MNNKTAQLERIANALSAIQVHLIEQRNYRPAPEYKFDPSKKYDVALMGHTVHKGVFITEVWFAGKWFVELKIVDGLGIARKLVNPAAIFEIEEAEDVTGDDSDDLPF